MDTVTTLFFTTVFVFAVEKVLVYIYDRIFGKKKRRNK